MATRASELEKRILFVQHNTFTMNHAKIFDSFPDKPRSTSSSAVGRITCAVIDNGKSLSARYCRKFLFIIFLGEF